MLAIQSESDTYVIVVVIIIIIVVVVVVVVALICERARVQDWRGKPSQPEPNRVSECALHSPGSTAFAFPFPLSMLGTKLSVSSVAAVAWSWPETPCSGCLEVLLTLRKGGCTGSVDRVPDTTVSDLAMQQSQQQQLLTDCLPFPL